MRMQELLEEVLLLDPRSLLFLSRVVEGIGALHGLDVEVSDITVATLQGHAHFELVVHHHVILPKSSRTMMYDKSTLLHVHLLYGHAPRRWVELSSLSAFADDRATTL